MHFPKLKFPRNYSLVIFPKKRKTKKTHFLNIKRSTSAPNTASQSTVGLPSFIKHSLGSFSNFIKSSYHNY